MAFAEGSAPPPHLRLTPRYVGTRVNNDNLDTSSQAADGAVSPTSYRECDCCARPHEKPTSSPTSVPEIAPAANIDTLAASESGTSSPNYAS
jgi:hypothetical protein